MFDLSLCMFVHYVLFPSTHCPICIFFVRIAAFFVHNISIWTFFYGACFSSYTSLLLNLYPVWSELHASVIFAKLIRMLELYVLYNKIMK